MYFGIPNRAGRRACLALVALWILAGCAQQKAQPGSGSSTAASSSGSSTGSLDALLRMSPTDRWETGIEKDGSAVVYANAGAATAARDAVLLLGCSSDEKSVVLMITPKGGMKLDPSIRPVTIILDGDTTLAQDWQSSKTSYWAAQSDPGFPDLLETLKIHKEVEFVLGGAGREIDRRRFTLNGAAKAIEDVMSNCAKKV
jgi:hypothetical protein